MPQRRDANKRIAQSLYDNFYEPLPETELKEDVGDCHRQLIEALDKLERHLVLQIIDDKDQIAKNGSIDSFIAGFRLVWGLSNEVNSYEKRV